MADSPPEPGPGPAAPAAPPRPGPSPGRSLVTPRECQVLALLARGWSPAVIADALGISTTTVPTYTRRVRRALGARTTTHAVAIALRAGIISL